MGEKDMTNEVMTKSKIKISGIISTDVEERSKTDKFELLRFKLRVKRLSGTYDEIVALIERKLYDETIVKKDASVYIEGEIRTYKNINGAPGENKTLVYVFVKNIITKDDDIREKDDDVNDYRIVGPIKEIKQTRSTIDQGKVCEFVISVESRYGNKFFIPCICWGINAEFVIKAEPGTLVEGTGRFQSRDYKKKLPNGDVENRTFYEVAIKNIKKL